MRKPSLLNLTAYESQTAMKRPEDAPDYRPAVRLHGIPRSLKERLAEQENALRLRNPTLAAALDLRVEDVERQAR